MGYDRECREAIDSLAEDFCATESELYLRHWRILINAKKLAHYSTAPECEVIAARLRMIELHPDPDDEEQMAMYAELPDREDSPDNPEIGASGKTESPKAKSVAELLADDPQCSSLMRGLFTDLQDMANNDPELQARIARKRRQP